MQLSFDLFGTLGPVQAGTAARTRPRVQILRPSEAEKAQFRPLNQNLDLVQPVAAPEPQPEPTSEPVSEPLPPNQALRRQIAELEHAYETDWGVAPFGDARIDACLPGGGLPLGRLHEIAGAGRERETPAAATGFVASLAQRAMKDGAIVWVLQRDDLYAPGLQAFGIDADRVIFVRVNKDKDVLAVQEDALRTRGVTACVGEVASFDLTAARRLQLVSEKNGATAFVLRRNLYASPRARAGREDGVASTTRWRIAPASSEAPQAYVGLGAPHWNAHLDRCRGGRTGAWLMQSITENDDDYSAQKGAIRVVAELANHTLAAGASGLQAAREWTRAHGGKRKRAASGRN